MKSVKIHIGRYLLTIICTLAMIVGGQGDCFAQKRKKERKSEKTERVSVQEVRSSIQKSEEAKRSESDGMLPFFIEGEDTIYYDTITASKVYSRIPRQKGREWREYYRLVHNFSKAYPYALVVRKLVIEADSIIAADNLKGAKREKYISQVQSELFEVFEGQMRKLTVSQGALIMKLVDREVGKSSYNLIKGYKNVVTAGSPGSSDPT